MDVAGERTAILVLAENAGIPGFWCRNASEYAASWRQRTGVFPSLPRLSGSDPRVNHPGRAAGWCIQTNIGHSARRGKIAVIQGDTAIASPKDRTLR